MDYRKGNKSTLQLSAKRKSRRLAAIRRVKKKRVPSQDSKPPKDSSTIMDKKAGPTNAFLNEIRSKFANISNKRAAVAASTTTTPSTPASIPAPEFIDCQGIGAQCKNISLPPLQNIESPSTSALLYLEPETNLRLDKCEEPTTESVYQDDDDGSGEDSDAVDNKDDMLDVSNTQILLNEVEPLSVEVEPLSVEVNPQYAMPKECELFGEYIAKHLQQLPFDVAFNLQSRIQTLVLQTRLEYIRQHPTKGPPMVKQETLVEDDHDYTKTTTNQPPSDNPVQIRGEKRLRNTDQPKAKRFNIDNRSSETQSSNSQTTHGKHKRTECTVFAEQIALHLEQLPEDVSLRLQSDIYELVMQVLPKPTDQDIPNRVKIKDEIIEVAPSQMMDEQSCETV